MGRFVQLRASSTGEHHRPAPKYAGRRLSRLLVAALLLLGAALPAVSAAGNCVDGGRPQPDEGGVGGTGML